MLWLVDFSKNETDCHMRVWLVHVAYSRDLWVALEQSLQYRFMYKCRMRLFCIVVIFAGNKKEAISPNLPIANDAFDCRSLPASRPSNENKD